MNRSLIILFAAIAAHFFFNSTLLAAVPVEDRSIESSIQPQIQQEIQPEIQPRPDSSLGAQPAYVGAGATSGGDSRLTELFYQLQQLRQEVQMLRGLVEEQGYQLNRLSKDQKEQYLDLDQRVSGVSRNSGSSDGPNAAASPSSTHSQTNTQVNGPNGSAQGNTSSEREAYTTAFNLMKGQKFAESVAAFERQIARYPNGTYTPNAFYWLGEVHLATNELEKSRQSFVQVINIFPQHQKISDTLYKLGVVYHRLEDSQKALVYLQRVQDEYPDTPAASLAKSYSAELR